MPKYDNYAILAGMKTRSRKILVVFSKTDFTHRQMLEGILRYAQSGHAPDWEVQLEQRNIYRRSFPELSAGNFSGIIAAVGNAADRRRYLKTGLPTVLFEPTLAAVDSAEKPANNVTVFNDHAAEGRAAAEYYLERGFRSFAYVGTASPTAWSEERRRGFCRRLAESGAKAHVYSGPGGRAAEDFTLEAPHLSRFLKRLPQPSALFAAHDERALQVLSAAMCALVDVPGHLAILGVDDDELLCTTASVPISSIPVRARDTGWKIAEAMHALLDGAGTPPVIRTCHTQVITRRSTDACVLDDPIVSRAVGFIGRNLARPIGVDDIAEAANCSRRTLQLRIRAALHSTPKAELQRRRRNEAMKLLAETRLPIGEIARRCGYCGPSHMGAEIMRFSGKRPTDIRREKRAN